MNIGPPVAPHRQEHSSNGHLQRSCVSAMHKEPFYLICYLLFASEVELVSMKWPGGVRCALRHDIAVNDCRFAGVWLCQTPTRHALTFISSCGQEMNLGMNDSSLISELQCDSRYRITLAGPSWIHNDSHDRLVRTNTTVQYIPTICRPCSR
jgi:hypothetical protein